MPRRLPVQTYIDGVLAGDRMVLSRAITLVESRLPSDRILADQVLQACVPHAGNSFRLGITGVPGVGKSTFIDAFGMYLVGQGHRVAVLAVDPSSQRTGGSILGDKTRMARLGRSDAAFVRPSPAGRTLGGVTRSTRETILLCEAAGYDYILVETVGVGQSEIAVHSMVDFFLLLMLAGAGDELQGIKKGIVEMAHGIVINKADGNNERNALRAKGEYKRALHLLAMSETGWAPPVQTCSALENRGMGDIAAVLSQYKTQLQENGWWDRLRKAQARQWMEEAIRFELEDQFFRHPKVKEIMPQLSRQVDAGAIPPTVAARNLIQLYLQSPDSELPPKGQ